MSSGLSQAEQDVIRKSIETLPSIREAVLFGSRAKGTFSAGSDVDLSVKGCSEEDAVRLSAILNEETTLPYFFDVVVYETIQSHDLIEHIDRVGLKIYEKQQ
jgi:predicted nucleotidyltransferase